MSRNVWADYWSAPKAPDERGCLPQGDPAVVAALDTVWREFALALPAGAKVLDLATGDGAVLRKLQAARPNLNLTGVDSAPSLPPAPPRIRLKAGVAMEALPFRPASFDAVTSQFGIEYGDTALIAAAVAQVLKPRGQLCAILHHQGSAVVGYSSSRRQALAWAARESAVLEKARRFTQATAAAALPIPPLFREAAEAARRLHPDQPVAAEFLTGILQTLAMGRGRPAAETLGLLATLEARAADEIGRLDALARAACGDGKASLIADQFEDAGINIAVPLLLTETGNRPLAWLLRGQAR